MACWVVLTFLWIWPSFDLVIILQLYNISAITLTLWIQGKRQRQEDYPTGDVKGSTVELVDTLIIYKTRMNLNFLGKV